METLVYCTVVQRLKVLLLSSGAYMVASLISVEYLCKGFVGGGGGKITSTLSLGSDRKIL